MHRNLDADEHALLLGIMRRMNEEAPSGDPPFPVLAHDDALARADQAPTTDAAEFELAF